MNAGCNDPRCPLNRRGVPHRPHGDIERDRVLDPCNDPRCALTRLGMPHNSHGPLDGPAPDAGRGAGRGSGDAAAGLGEAAGRDGRRRAAGPGNPGEAPGPDAGPGAAAGPGNPGEAPGPDAGPGATAGNGSSGSAGRPRDGGAGRRPPPADSPTSPADILDEAARHLRQHAGGTAAAGRPGGGAREDERILGATDPHGILGIPRGATVEQARSRYKSLVKRYDAARGIIHKTAPEREKSNLIMARINGAFEAFKSARAAS